jgi:hypothetical protein
VDNYSVSIYNVKDKAIWNAFVKQAKNATFLFDRDFMEYHQDRFDDFSLLIFKKDKLVAVLPANRVGETLFSHQGLTYGGLVLLPNSKLEAVINILRSVLEYLNENGIVKLVLKAIPSIYCDYASDEIDYLAFICQGKVIMKNNIAVIALKNKLLFSKSRRECINRGKKNSLIIKEETCLDTFWNELLIPNLNEKYASKPVHTIEEIMFLKTKFPENIRHFNVYYGEALVCGTTLFVTAKVAKAQYLAGCDKNNALGSIDFLYDFLIKEVAKDKLFFDFGPSHEDNGLKIVKNINFWKESFGSHSVVQNFYEIETSNFNLLEKILV